MSTKSLDVTAIRPRRVLPWAARIGGAAIGVAIGLLTAGFFLYTAANPNTDASASLSQPVAALGPVTFEIVPSPVKEANAQFFFGTGDGSAGYYSERPVQ